MTGAAQAKRAWRTPRDGKDRLDADEGVGRANDHRAQPFVGQRRQKVRMRPRMVRAVKGQLAHDRAALKAHEIVLEIEPTLIRSQSGPQTDRLSPAAPGDRRRGGGKSRP